MTTGLPAAPPAAEPETELKSRRHHQHHDRARRPAGTRPPAAASAAATATASSSAVASSSAHLTRGACSDPDLKKANAQCGFLKVPLDYRHPHGAKISLVVSRIKHTSPASQYQGIILTNPGGPGGRG